MAVFDDFVATKALALTRFAYVLCGDSHFAQDLVQAALERAYLRWLKAGPVAFPEAYVRQVIVREYVTTGRRRSVGELPVSLPEPAGAPDLFDGAAELDERDRMWRVLATLPARQRAVLVLRFYEDLDDQAIGQLLGCARGTVRSLASRALADLRTYPELARGAIDDTA